MTEESRQDAAISPWELALLRELTVRYPSIGSARAEIAALSVGLLLPKPTIHVISDIHGDFKKLRHVINNASGSLRPLVEDLFSGRMNDVEIHQFLAVLYYPYEAMQKLRSSFTTEGEQLSWALHTLRFQFEIVRKLASAYRPDRVMATFPPECRELFQELLEEPFHRRGETYVDTMVGVFSKAGVLFDVVRAASRVVRNLSVGEIVVAGDMGDRGLRIDRVIDYLMRQPHVTITWGNHDVSWMGACLGQEAAIATVLRISLRYSRLTQLEEGYGISLAPLEKLAQTVYGDDPATQFKAKGSSERDDLLVMRMQKAMAILNFKLEGQTSRRHPEWNLEHRNLLHRIDHQAGTVEIDGKTYPLLDTHLPTIDPADPYTLSPEEQECMRRLRESFVSSNPLWEQMCFLVRRGSMWQCRDDVLIFHACVPTDAEGNYLPLQVDGVERKGRELFDAIASLVRRAFRKGADHAGTDADWLWYLWGGALSPLFGKDKMATFETYFVADKETHKEIKNPYFSLMHDAEFCRSVLREFGVSADGLIVNGHVPVKIEEGEQPVKRGGNAVTIDGAFSEAYGDHGYTLILGPDQITLAEHSHFASIEEAITAGADIVPKVSTLRAYNRTHRVGDTEVGQAYSTTISLLERLIVAYQEGLLQEPSLP